MPYAIKQDIIDRWPAAPADPGDAALDTAIEDASALIDTYLAKRWDVPITAPPRSLVNLCVDLACYLLSRSDGQLSEDIRKRHEDALATLKDVAGGALDLPGLDSAPSGEGTIAGPGAVVMAGPERIFGRGKGW